MNLLHCLPFGLLLVLIAALPLVAPRFWHPNRNKLLVSALVSLPVLAFLIGYHPAGLGVILSHYVSFIVLLAALFVISGGILVTGDLRATPLANTFYLLFGAVLAVFFQVPAPFREMAMLAMALLSLRFTPKELRARNQFTFYPIAEVAILFAGIFITMEPVLRLLSLRGSELSLTRPYQFFWATGLLSSFLDNAPTYLTFFSLAESVTRDIASALPAVAGVRVDLLRAISCGAVFMGAMTYIGNAPNFMVKSIAEEQKVRVPHFLGYMMYSGMVLIPVFLLVTLVFFPG